MGTGVNIAIEALSGTCASWTKISHEYGDPLTIGTDLGVTYFIFIGTRDEGDKTELPYYLTVKE